MPHDRIDGRALWVAAVGHVERLDVQDADGLAVALEAEGIDSVEAQALGATLRDLRPFGPETRAGWVAGFTDGLVLGVRAARAARGHHG
jgi:hypothetical protein